MAKESKGYQETVEIPQGITVKINGPKFTVKGLKGEVSREIFHLHVSTKMDGGKITFHTDSSRKLDKALVGTFAAHLANMFKGVTDGFEYKMKCVYAHFPIKMSVKGKEFVVENMLGENKPRRTNIVGGAKVAIAGEFVTVTGISLEEVSQTAANIELMTRIKDRDPRRFQDGIYIIQKGA
ncbi:MAG: 50S ribosomal protein L6 [Candidatus Thermoplasmatota archaeon]|nr:50S ribosomal protein L6 [Candidatus Thermoplasmatota archaeon]